MKKRKWFSVLLATLIFCGSVMNVEAAVIKQNISSVSLMVGQTRSFVLSGTTSKASYKSSNASVASVSKDGVISAKKQGNCTITATWNKKKYTCKVTVYKKGAYVGKYTSGYEGPFIPVWDVTIKSVSGNKIKMQIDWYSLRSIHSTGTISGTLIGNKVSFSFTDSYMSRKGTGKMWIYPNKVKLSIRLGEGAESTMVLPREK